MKTKSEEDLFTDIGDNVLHLKSMIAEWVEGKRELKEQQKQQLEEYESKMLSFLWRCRKLLSTATISRMVGMSRQTLYEKWQKHGFDVNEI